MRRLILILAVIMPAGVPAAGLSTGSYPAALESLNRAQSALLHGHWDEMMPELHAALQAAGEDPIVRDQAVKFAQKYYGREKPGRLLPGISKKIVTPFVLTIRKIQEPGRPAEYEVNVTLRSSGNDDFKNISIMRPDGSVIPILEKSRPGERFRSEYLPDHWVYRPTSARFTSGPESGLYALNIEVRGEAKKSFLLILNPDSGFDQLPSLISDRSGVPMNSAHPTIHWQSTASASFTPGMRRELTFEIKKPGGLRPLWTFEKKLVDHPVASGSVNPLHQGLEGSGLAPGVYELYLSSLEMVMAEDLDIIYDYRNQINLKIVP